MKDGFLKAAAFSPALRVADCTYNAQQILADVQAAAARGVKLAAFPEFCLTGYTCGDLFLQHTLQTGALDALQTVLDGTRTLDTVVLVGLPLLVHGKLYNCAAVLCRGQLLGLVPKTYLPNYGEFYEKRQFTPGSTEVETITVCGQQVPFGTSLLFRCRSMPSFVLGVELCEDLWSALPPSTFHALAGATVIANLSASDETVGKAEYRRALVSNQSARLLCGYLYASAGHGESTQDMVFAGHDLIAENGTLLAETAPFAGGIAETEIDCQRMEAERARNTSFELSRDGYTTVEFDLELTETPLTRWIDPAPFVPGDPKRRAERCELILKMQADGLAKRLEHAHAKTAVIGISGGLDSCLALLVAVRAMKQLGRPASDVLQNFEEQTHTWLIREADKKDVKAFETLYNDDEVKRFLPYPLEKQAQTCKDWEDWIESLHQYVYPSEEPSMWVLADENDDMIGRVGLEYKEENKENGTPDGYYLGYAILPKWRKKGLAAKAASRLLKYCFEYWQLKEVYLLCSSENMASVKTALACGFTKMSSIEVSIQNSVFLQDIVEHCLNDCACVSTSLLFLFARKAL